ncbi:signal recognition particle-docking protein FtsY [Corynebacterium sp. ES2715-CONJ3]|uniref:signal recognition particle-docking protein FtsY n=1 Tax=Corynebacterium sp. ES2715-CONJ3 TaxID=2974028 RepID=UPI0021680C74|nr:signal recognition particle-docking protein FtsY [Corynebacterium sp. ES2715-CONJ3]MCS4490883.1 signal recognition particle-docking protein FtsY [Corynebacterium sp. ES2715-CONJ3]
MTIEPLYGIILAAVVVAIIVAILIVIGLKRRKTKTIAFQKPDDDQPKELTQEQKSGNYQAHGGFQFAPAEKHPELLDPPQPPGADQTPISTVEPLAPIPPSDGAKDLKPDISSDFKPEAELVTAADEALPDNGSVDADTEGVADDLDDNFVELVDFEDIAALEENDGDDKAEDAADTSDTAPTGLVEPANISAHGEVSTSSERLDGLVDRYPESARVEDTIDDIAPAAGRMGRLRGRLARSQNVFGQSVLGILSAGDLNEEAWEDIEAELIQADLGVAITMTVVEELRDMIAVRGVESEAQARSMLRECLIKACKPDMDRSLKAIPYGGKPAIILMVGVNGTGKTTTTGKLARVLVSMGHKVLLGAADTFRAAAADQLEAWGRRVGAEVVRGAEAADPASVAFDAVSRGVDHKADVVVIDTAGRLHNSANLMDQLAKVKRVVEKKTNVDEVLLVLDATTGQNGLNQAKVFGEVVNITGVVLTKLDGTAKGGIVFQVQENLGVPVKLVGLGEGADDLAPFEVESFVDALLG